MRSSTGSEGDVDVTRDDSRTVSGVSTTSSSSFTSVSSMSSTLSNDTAVKLEGSPRGQKVSLVSDEDDPDLQHDPDPGDVGDSSDDAVNMNGALYMAGRHRDGVNLDDLELDLDDLTGSQQDLKALHEKMVEERKKEQQMAAMERQRLEEILSMCAEYEKQIERERGVVPTTKDNKRDSDTRSEGSSSSRPESRNSMTKIKTNGSLTMLATSPSSVHKEVSFEHWRRHSANSSASEDELGSENGTIKRRPNGHGIDGNGSSPGAVGDVSGQDVVGCDYVFGTTKQETVHTDRAALHRYDNPHKQETGTEHAQSPPAGMRLQLVKIGDGAYAGPVLRSTGNTSPRSPPGNSRSITSDPRSPLGSDSERGFLYMQTVTPSTSGMETASDQSINKTEVSPEFSG